MNGFSWCARLCKEKNNSERNASASLCKANPAVDYVYSRNALRALRSRGVSPVFQLRSLLIC